VVIAAEKPKVVGKAKAVGGFQRSYFQEVIIGTILGFIGLWQKNYKIFK
jgi:hypothetical protein